MATTGTGKLSVDWTSVDTTLTLDPGNAALTPGQVIQIENEQVTIQNVTGPNTAVVARGANGTAATNHAAGTNVSIGVPGASLQATANPEPLPAMGTHLTIESTTTVGTYIPVALVGPLSGPSLSRDTIDVTNHDNQDGYKQFIGSLKDGGEIALTLYWNPDATGQYKPDGLYAAFEDGLTHRFQIVLPSKSYAWSFSGVISKMNFKYDPNSAQSADCTIKVSGKPVFDAFTPAP